MKRLFAAGCLLFVCGCWGPTPIPQTGYSPDQITSAAMARCDANKDGKLDSTELKQCPSIAFALAEIDTNNDRAVSADELRARVVEYIESKIFLSQGPEVRVVRGSKGVANVTVSLVPEDFMGDSFRTVTGTTVDYGTAQLKAEGQAYPGAQLGFYKVMLSLKDSSGKETLPARFNSATNYGVEVGPLGKNRMSLSIDLDK